MNPAEWEPFEHVDVRTADIKNLTDIRDIKINRELPREERIKEFLAQVKNPYCFRVGKTAVSVGYSGKKTFQQCMEEYLLALQEASSDLAGSGEGRA